MKNYLYLIFALVLSCKTAATSSTQSLQRAELDIIDAPEFGFLALGQSIDLGHITLTKLQGDKAAITAVQTTTNEQSTGTPTKVKDKSKTEIKINSENKDKSKDKTKDKSNSGVDKSRIKSKSQTPFLVGFCVIVLLVFGLIYFLYPKLKKLLKPPIL